MADEIVIPTATTPSPAPTTPPVEPSAGDPGATVLGGAQESPPAPLTTDLTAPNPNPSAADPNAPPAAVVPEKYELALEGLTLDPELVTAADPVLRELNLTNEQANKLLPIAQQMAERTQAAIAIQLQDAAAAQRREWHDAYLADSEIGGTNRARTEALSAKALDAVGYTQGHPFRTLLNETGLGNHPDMIRAFAKFGEMVGEDGGFVRAGSVTTPKTPWEARFPNEGK